MKCVQLPHTIKYIYIDQGHNVWGQYDIISANRLYQIWVTCVNCLTSRVFKFFIKMDVIISTVTGTFPLDYNKRMN